MSDPRILSAAVGAAVSASLFDRGLSSRRLLSASTGRLEKEERPGTFRERGPVTKQEPSRVEQSGERGNDKEGQKRRRGKLRKGESAREREKGREREREERLYAGCTGGRGGPSSAGGLLSHLYTRSHIRSWVARHRRRPRTLRHQLRGKGRQTSPRRSRPQELDRSAAPGRTVLVGRV